ncbi:sodium:solute symporter family protein [Candidatus Woesearchaeota archaeon]|nr:sodium:solute symporter family protein [Candidatus Woesearchaeota archaeon]
MNWAIVFFLLYFLVVFLIGIISSRSKTEDSFMIAERKVKGVQLAATMSAGFFDGATLAIFVAYIYQFGFSAIWLFIGLAFGFILLRKYAINIKTKADLTNSYSMPEFFYNIFGKSNGLLFSIILIIQFFGILIVNLIISGKILSSIFSLPLYIAVSIGGLVVLTYLFLAGFKAVLRTDYFQFMIMILMSLTVGLFLFGKADVPSLDINLTNLGFGNILGFVLIGAFSIVVAPDLWQRIFAAKDEKSVKKGLSYSAFILPFLAVIISVVGLVTKQFFPNIVPEDALLTGFSNLLPLGLKEFGIILLYAVSLSSSDTITFVVSSIVTRDLKNYSIRCSEYSMIKLTRVFMVIFVSLAVLIASFYQDIIRIGFSLGSLSLVLFPVVFGSFYWKLKEKAVFYSLMMGIITVLILFITNLINPETAVISLPVSLFTLIICQKILK